MDRRWLERVKKISNEELLRETERKGSRNIIAGKEMLSRISEKRILEEEKYLGAILENIRVSGSPKTQKEAKRVINETAELIEKRGYLNEKNLSNILKKAEPLIKEQVGRKWLDRKKASNYSLREIIKAVPPLIEEAEERLLKQNPSKDDLYFIVMEGKGKSQPEAWELLRKKGMPTDDACDFIQLKDDFAILTWQMLKEEGRIKELSPEDLFEILDYTDSQKIKEEIPNLLWLKKKELSVKQLVRLEELASMITIEEPEGITNWIEKKIVILGLNLEQAITLKEETTSPVLKLRLARRALELTEKAIEKKEEQAIEEEKKYFYVRGGEYKTRIATAETNETEIRSRNSYA